MTYSTVVFYQYGKILILNSIHIADTDTDTDNNYVA